MRHASALVLVGLLGAQDPRFQIQSRLVLIPVTVTDAQGGAVEGLEASDFVVLDNGRPQRVAVDTFATGVSPIALVVAVQTSSISAAAIEKVQRIGGMIQPLITGERGCAALLAFSSRVEWRQECTADQDAFQRAFRDLRPGEEKAARMLDAVYGAVQRLQSMPEVRRVLLVISESRDRGSETDLHSVMVAAQASGVTIYTATYSAFKTGFTTKSRDGGSAQPPQGPPPPNKDPGNPPGRERIYTPQGTAGTMPPPEQRVDILGGVGELMRLGKSNAAAALTSQTGGSVFPFSRQRGLEDAIGKLGEELHTQYLLSFTPETPTPGYHRLEVRVVRRGEWRIRARPGYWSR